MALTILVVIFALAAAQVQSSKHDCKEKLASAKAKQMPGQFTPRCEKDGSYKLKQFHGSTCFCVDDFGTEIEGTVTPMHKCRDMDCKPFLTSCLRKRLLSALPFARLFPKVNSFVPNCDTAGDFERIQCYGSKSCWCSYKNGSTVEGTYTPAKDGQKPDCPAACFEAKERAQQMKTQDPPLLGVFEPECSSNGDYVRKQCHEYMCFCVHPETGFKIKGTSVSRKYGDSLEC